MNNCNNKKVFIRIVHMLISRLLIAILIGLVSITTVSCDMYTDEMLYQEGLEKSVSYFTEEELREYGEYYKELEINFQSKIASFIQDYANRTNRRGDKIYYGVYGRINENESVLNDDYVEGVTINYVNETEDRTDGESNFKDILAFISMTMDQEQSKNKAEVKELLNRLFDMTHTFTGESDDLYSCDHGCFVDRYHCSDVDNNFSHCNIHFQPFSITPHSEYDTYEEEDFEIVDPIGECEVCMKTSKPCYQRKGCVQNGTCYHGDSGGGGGDDDGGDEHSLGRTEPTPDVCTNWSTVSKCTYDGDGDHDCSDDPLGCEGYYKCNGHPHYECPDGHWYVCCMGHTNITIDIKIMYIDEIVKSFNNG